MDQPTEKELRQEIEDQVKAHGEYHVDVANAIHALAKHCYANQHYAETKELLKNVLTITEKVLGPLHPVISRCTSDLAIICHQLGLYDEAEEWHIRAILICEETLGHNHPDACLNLVGLGGVYRKLGLYEKATTLIECALTIRENALGYAHPGTVDFLCILTELMREQGLYDKSIDRCNRSIDICKKTLEPDHSATARVLFELGQDYFLKELYEEARDHLQRALLIARKVKDINPAFVVQMIRLLCLAYGEQKLYVKSEPLYEQAIALSNQVNGETSLVSAELLNGLGGVCLAQGRYKIAGQYIARAVLIIVNELGQFHPDLITPLRMLAFTCRMQSDFSLSESHYKHVLAIIEEIRGSDDEDYAECLWEIALLHEEQGLLEKTSNYMLKAIAINDKTLGPGHSKVIDARRKLASSYYRQRLFIQSGQVLRYLLSITKQRLEPNPLEVAAIMDELACSYMKVNLFDQAEPLLTSSLAIRKRELGLKHPDTALSLNNIAFIYINQELYGRAEFFLKEALSIYEHIHGHDHLSTALALDNLGHVYGYQDKHAESIFYHVQALEIQEKILGFDHYLIANSLNGIACAHLEQGRYEEAESLLNRALDILGNHTVTDDLYASNVLGNMAVVKLFMECPAESKASFFASIRAHLKWLYTQLPLMSSCQRYQRLASDNQVLHLGQVKKISGIFAHHQTLFLPVLFFTALNRQGLELEVERCHARLANVSGEHQPLVRQLHSLVTVLSSSQVESELLRSLADKRDELEALIYGLYPDLQLKTVEVSELAAELPLDAALIMLTRQPLPGPFFDTDVYPRYRAFILFPNVRIEAVDLGSAEHVEGLVREARADTLTDDPDAALAWSDLSDQLLSPLLHHLQGVKRWYLTLDGELHRVPFHVLPHPGKPNKLLVEAVSLQLLTSGRDLLDQHQPGGAPSAVSEPIVVAAPAFDQGLLSIDQVAQDSGDHQPRSRDMGALTAWPPLPNSAIEGQKIAELLGATLHTGSQATTVTVQLAQRPRVLHIATHGFFLPDQSEPQEHQSWLPLDGQDLLARFRGEDPMLRSGLVFAGANHPVADPSEDDGYLTAQEAVHLDLQGTELVTLSACDAGSGDIRTGEGVYGLQRALIVAGARSMLLSLWPVPDAATCEFMVRFYTLLKQGAGRFEALVAVQREFRQHDNVRWRHPYYWGAWQLIGDGGPIANL